MLGLTVSTAVTELSKNVKFLSITEWWDERARDKCRNIMTTVFVILLSNCTCELESS